MRPRIIALTLGGGTLVAGGAAAAWWWLLGIGVWMIIAAFLMELIYRP
ncbi:hypothetical protein OTB20_22715 [Streptomyces sp. H27-H1]|nr:hypothetical protein [Streptomyces sp. H27-H1]MCY0928975.1 hypothetical protein [Streptomyces sp. H27-H1]